jgi:hypothetical protein
MIAPYGGVHAFWDCPCEDPGCRGRRRWEPKFAYTRAGVVPVVKPQGTQGTQGTGETGVDRPATPIDARPPRGRGSGPGWVRRIARFVTRASWWAHVSVRGSS